MSKPLSIDELKKLAIDKGGYLISNEYLGIKKPLVWQCYKSHQFERTPFDVKYMGYWCPECSNRVSKHSKYRVYKMLAKDINASLISYGLIDKYYKLTLQCNTCSTIWHTQASHTRNKHGCPACARVKQLSLREAQQLAVQNNGECLSTAYKNANSPLLWRCHLGHEWQATLGSIRHVKSWCPECARVEVRKYTIIDAIQSAAAKDGCFISSEYTTADSVYEWQCKKHHIFKMTYTAVRKNRWCPRCKYKTEDKVRQIFEKLTKYPFPSARPKWLKNPNTSGTLCLDGFCKELALAFEYDGEQHYKTMPHIKESVSSIRAKDKIKTDLCKINNVTLIRIPFYIKDLESYIKQCLEEWHDSTQI